MSQSHPNCYYMLRSRSATLKMAPEISVLLVLVTATHGMLLDDFSCSAFAPCTCPNANLIECGNKSLTQVPKFNHSDRNFGHMEVHLEDNQLTSIPIQAFAALNHVVQTEVAMYLTGNSITHINDHAFDLIQNSVVYLNLEYNKLSQLPIALNYLVHLKTLLLAHNPLQTLDDSVMHHIGRTAAVGTFSFGLAGGHWPASVGELRHLKSLLIDPSQLHYIPANAFGHASHGITRLVIGKSHLEVLPNAVCNLHNLVELQFDTTAVINENVIVPDCRHNLARVTSLTFNGEGLFEFPARVFDSFPNVENLELLGMSNSFTGLEYASIPSDNKVKTLALTGDYLVTVPDQIVAFKHLEHLDLGNNSIQCGCLMKWMATWDRRNNVTIYGKCDNYQMTIQEFVDNDLEMFCH